MTGKKVADYRPARRNANKHTARGLGALQQSVQTDGWIGAMTAAADGEMIAGSARIETVAQVFGTDAEPIVVETDGSRPVLVVRTDIPHADDKRAQRLALADNRIHQLDLDFDVEVLAGFDADVIGELWSPYELSQLGEQWANLQGDDPNAEWKGMPEFEQEDKTGFQSIHVHFMTREDRDAFAELIGQNIGDKTRALWYPQAERIDMASELYADES